MTLSTSHAADLLTQDEYSSFTYAGARALVEYLEEIEESNGEDMELDCVAIRCDFAQYDSLQDWAQGYFSDWKDDLGIKADTDEDEIDELIREYINDRGTLIEFSGGVIVSSF